MTSRKGTYRVTSAYRLPERPSHNGIDTVAADKEIRAIWDTVKTEVVMGYNGGRGNLVRLYHSPTLRVIEQHLNSVRIKSGQNVKQGDVIGIEGWTGECRPVGPGGSHLHSEVQSLLNGKWVAVNPSPYTELPNKRGTYQGNDRLDTQTSPPPIEPEPSPQPEPIPEPTPIGGIQMVKLLNVNGKKTEKVQLFSAPDVKKVTLYNQLPDGLTFGDWTLLDDTPVPLANSTLKGVKIIARGKVVWVALKPGITKIVERTMQEYYDYFVTRGRNN